jgi:hypothetical protein
MFIKIVVILILLNVFLVPLDTDNLFLRNIVSILIIAHIFEIIYHYGYLSNSRYSYWIVTFPLVIYSAIIYLSSHTILFTQHLEIIAHEYFILFMGLLSEYDIVSVYLPLFLAMIVAIYIFNLLYITFNSYVVIYLFVIWLIHILLMLIVDSPLKNIIYDILDICLTSIPAIIISIIIYNKHHSLYERHYSI